MWLYEAAACIKVYPWASCDEASEVLERRRGRRLGLLSAASRKGLLLAMMDDVAIPSFNKAILWSMDLSSLATLRKDFTANNWC